jgi:hypothetical protein
MYANESKVYKHMIFIGIIFSLLIRMWKSNIPVTKATHTIAIVLRIRHIARI